MINFKDYFWDKCEDLHKRYIFKNTTKGNILELFSKLQIALTDFCKLINDTVVKDYSLFPEQNTTQNEAIEYIKYIFTIQTTQYNLAIELLKNNIILPFKTKKEEDFKKEKELYNEFRKISIKFNESMLNLQKIKEKFYQCANIAEMSTMSAKQINIRKLNNNNDKEQQNLSNLLEQKSIEALIEAKKNDEKYTELIKETNINREKFIEKQTELLNFYKEKEYDDISNYKTLLLDYLSTLKNQNNVIKENLIEMEEKITKMNISKDLQILIDDYSSDKKPMEEINYEFYEPKIDIKNCFKDDEYTLYYNTISTMKSYINILPDFDINLESKKQEIRDLCKIFFSLNLNYNEEHKQRLLELLKEEWSHEYFLVILSKQRTNARYCRNKNLIYDLSEILNLIINISEKKLNYKNAKNCIILSQTFFYEENKNKIYLYNYIKNNKWIRNPNFWRGLIDTMINKELKDLQKNNNINEEMLKVNLDNIIFSQVLSYTTTMKDFQVDQRIIIKIIDQFMKKYEISKQLNDAIYNNIGDENYVEKLRKEYESNPDLEQKIIDEINSEENNDKQQKEQTNEIDINKEGKDEEQEIKDEKNIEIKHNENNTNNELEKEEEKNNLNIIINEDKSEINNEKNIENYDYEGRQNKEEITNNENNELIENNNDNKDNEKNNIIKKDENEEDNKIVDKDNNI